MERWQDNERREIEQGRKGGRDEEEEGGRERERDKRVRGREGREA